MYPVQPETIIIDGRDEREARARLDALRTYIVLRAAGSDQASAIELAGAYDDEPLPHEVRQKWAEEDKWELAFRAAAGAAVLAADLFRTDARVKEALTQLGVARDVRTHAARDATTAGATKADVEKYKMAQGVVRQFEQELADLERRAAYTYAEQIALPRWHRRRAELLADLTDRYESRGPQYVVLCEQLTSSIVRKEQIEWSGVPIDTDEWAKLNQTIQSLTNQLQKYTETIKTEVIKEEVQDAILKVITIIEHVVAPRAPTLWDEVTAEIERRLLAEPILDDDRSVLAQPVEVIDA